MGVPDGGQSVGDYQDGAAFHDPLQGLSHNLLILSIQRRCSLIQDENPRVPDGRPSDGQSLPLAS